MPAPKRDPVDGEIPLRLDNCFFNQEKDIMDKAMIQYVGQKDSRVDLQIRILPQEKEFHGEGDQDK